ncbi:MAG TPA: hypothetical protein VFS92_08540 [Planctomycetota bacterium]|nr:hypothetical protein [Planctomycetota bacterium]
MPTEDSRAVATGDAAKKAEPTVDELDVDLEALAKMKPLLVYYYVDPISDPMDENYKFSRKFELSVLGETVNEALAKSFRLKKVSLPADGDMKKVQNQARIEIWSPTKAKVRVITRADEALLNKSPFLAAAKTSVAKSDKLVKDEVARITKLRLERDKKAKEAEQKAKEPETAKN